MDGKTISESDMFTAAAIEVMKESLDFYKTERIRSALKSKSALGIWRYITQVNEIVDLQKKLEEVQRLFLQDLSEKQIKLLKDSLVSYKQDGSVREKAVDYKLGIETDENRDALGKYSVLCELIGRLKSC